MDRFGLPVVWLLLALFAGGSVAAGEADETNGAEQFLSALQASWQGRAELTPVGPRPYDITFEGNANGEVSGFTGDAVLHHWRFYQQDNNLKIRFLSTFGGNSEPVFLHAREWDERGILFRAKEPELLSVRVSVSSDLLLIDVFHWDELHVSIRLTRMPLI